MEDYLILNSWMNIVLLLLIINIIVSQTPLIDPLVEDKNEVSGIDGRIIGGNFAKKDENPFMAHIRVGNAICGGVTLSHNIILTAAHCTFNKTKEQMKVYYGLFDLADPISEGKREFSIIEIYSKPYDKKWHSNDSNY